MICLSWRCRLLKGRGGTSGCHSDSVASVAAAMELIGKLLQQNIFQNQPAVSADLVFHAVGATAACGYALPAPPALPAHGSLMLSDTPGSCWS